MQRDSLARFGQWIFPATILAIGVAVWANVLRGPQPWQGVVEMVAGFVMAGWGAALATDWRGLATRYVEAARERRRRRCAAPEDAPGYSGLQSLVGVLSLTGS